jgi:hypothetical protein
MPPDQATQASIFRHNYFARSQPFIERQEFARWITLRGKHRKDCEISAADRLQNLVTGWSASFSGPRWGRLSRYQARHYQARDHCSSHDREIYCQPRPGLCS